MNLKPDQKDKEPTEFLILKEIIYSKRKKYTSLTINKYTPELSLVPFLFRSLFKQFLT